MPDTTVAIPISGSSRGETLISGDFIGPYEVQRRIGRGGMGTVYLCHAVGDGPVEKGREVAVKVMANADPEERRRFTRESRYLQSLHHPNIVRVFDAGEDQGRMYLVMPVISGRRLDEIAGPGQPVLAHATAVSWMIQALEALHVAHLAGILHRDLKPGNLMLDAHGRIQLLDFGLASAPDQESRLTRNGDVVGTPAYMPPEQAAGRRDELSRRSDIYSLGACLYELLTGRQPFTAGNPMALLRAVIDQPLTPPRLLRADIPKDLETIVLVAMAKDQRDRYRSAEEMAADLRRFASGRPLRARRPPLWKQAWRWAIRNRRTLATGGLVVFLVGAGGTLGVLRLMRAMRDQERASVEAVAHAWMREWVWPDQQRSPFPQWRDHPPLGPGAQVAMLPSVDGAVRLEVDTSIPDSAGGGTAIELLISDRDIGAGYHLRVSLAPPLDELSLLRDDRIVAKRSVTLPRGQAMTLRLEHLDGVIQGSCEWADPAGDQGRHREELGFTDLDPLQSSDASGVYVLRHRKSATITGARLDRRRSGELVSALATADAFRQDKRYARALQLYQAFLRDHPTSEQAADARFRYGLCQERLGDTAGALGTFQTVVEGSDTPPRLSLLATFHAWSCALRLGRYGEAERWFEIIRRDFDLPTLAASIPDAALRDLRQDYTVRAQALAIHDPERAERMAITAAEIASYRNDASGMQQSQLLAGNLQLGRGATALARETFLSLSGDLRLSPAGRAEILLHLGHADRLLDDPGRAGEDYSAALDLSAPSDRARIRLWQGDLAADMRDNEVALQLWGRTDGASDPYTDDLLLRLTAKPRPAIPPEEQVRDAEEAYVIARSLLLDGDQAGARHWLERSVSIGPSHRWPVPLARLMIDRLTNDHQPVDINAQPEQ